MYAFELGDEVEEVLYNKNRLFLRLKPGDKRQVCVLLHQDVPEPLNTQPVWTLLQRLVRVTPVPGELVSFAQFVETCEAWCKPALLEARADDHAFRWADERLEVMQEPARDPVLVAFVARVHELLAEKDKFIPKP